MKTFHRSLFVTSVLALASVTPVLASTNTATASSAQTAPRTPSEKSEAKVLFGRIKSFDAATGALTIEHGQHGSAVMATVYVEPSTTLTLDGKAVGASQLVVGQHVTIEPGPENDGCIACVSVRARTPHAASVAKAKKDS